MPVELRDYLVNSGTALVLHGKRGLVDADLAQLRDLSPGQRALVTCVIISGTNITGESFRYFAFLPNLKALYANKTLVNDDAPFEFLPKTMEIVNLDHTRAGDTCISKLRTAPNLYSVRLGNTNLTDRGVDILAAMPNLRECHVDGKAVSEHARQRLLNAMILRAIAFPTVMQFPLHFMQLEARKFALQIRHTRPAWHYRLPQLVSR